MICAQSPLMSDPLRTDASRADADVTSEPDREGKIEQLLLIGLDHYFAARYELAINVWTRVLFLDRSHARARAYIDRARSALAEQLRESEELLQNGVAAFERGEGDEARRLLQAAIDGGAPSEEALAVLDRLNRLEAAPAPSATPSSSPSRRDRVRRVADGAAPAERGLRASAIAVASVIIAVAALAAGIDWRSIAARSEPAPAALSAPVPRDAPLPLPRRADGAAARSRAVDRRPSARRAHRSRRGASDRSAARRGRSPQRRHPAAVAGVDPGAAHRGAGSRERSAQPMKCPKPAISGSNASIAAGIANTIFVVIRDP